MKKSKKLLALFLMSAMVLSSGVSATAVGTSESNQLNSNISVSNYTDKSGAEDLQVESDKNSTGVQSNATNDKVVLNKANATTKVGTIIKLNATASSSTNLQWTSSNNSIASVDRKGNVMGISAGEATISCTSTKGAKAVCKISVTQPATSVALNAHSISWNVGKSAHFYPVVGPTNAENKSVTYKSSNTKVATVSSSGLLTAVSPGTCVITCTSKENPKAYDTCTVTVKKPNTVIKLSNSSIAINSGTQQKLTATVTTNQNSKNLSWSSSNTAVATVNSNGVVTAKANGTCVITATATDGSGALAKCSVKVIQLANDITLSSTYQSINVNETATLTAKITPLNATTKTVRYSSSNTNVATVTNKGVITAVGAGACTITAKTTDDSNKTATCTVIVKQPITNIAMENALTLSKGTTTALNTVIAPANATNKTLTYTSSNPNVATVNNNGVVTAISQGVCTISATSNDGSNKKAVCTITVNNPVTNVTLNTHSITWNVGKSAHFRPTVSPTDASNVAVTFQSSNPSVATVSDKGLLTAVGAGTCTITCTALDGSGKYDTCTVTVKQPVTSVTLNTHSIKWNVGKSGHFRPIVKPDNATNIAITYKSSDPTIATVNDKGLLTAVGAGTCTITCTALDGSGKYDTCTVTVKDNAPKGQQIADFAKKWVGVTQYVWGGTSLITGADCSGFVCSVYENFGYNLWGSRVDLDTVGYSVPLSEAKPGDILVYYGHVGIYAGNGQVTHALNEYYDVLTTDISWGGTLRCVRRVVD
ncbi:MAG: Ig-like domain-containing protein [Acutalibacteraceae bacterium]|nr:Ig-like domain-containing protein [Acutalibacteraceae bacterium]